MKKILPVLLYLLLTSSLTARFDIEDYKTYLAAHQDMTVSGLLQEYPAGYFLKEVPTDFLSADYAESIDINFKLTDYEKHLISKHGFMVSERLDYYTFMQAFWDVYQKDMPVFISSDAVLHALHYSFDEILIMYERRMLVEELSTALNKLKNSLKSKSSPDAPEVYVKALDDMDVYLTVAQNLLKGNAECVFSKNKESVDKLLHLIEMKKPADYPLFSSTPRNLDFSQFTVRGHYSRFEDLKMYFKAMMWLGRTEILLNNPESMDPKHSEKDIQRMTILAALLAETAEESGAGKNLENMDAVLTYLLGRQDNINLWEVQGALNTLGYTAFDISKEENRLAFKEELLQFSSANQLYNSQILFSNPFSPEQIEPPAAFLLMGQRPIIDGFITANTTYDNILFNGSKIRRMVPSTLDILFSLGNDAAIQLLVDELEKYPYSSNLAALRYLIDGYGEDFWRSSTYTNWVDAIRSLNPPERRENLPKFMQTAAWWQKTMNTQLASWAEMRHDFLLYAKQPYTGGITCFYPHGYVEPVPEFYETIKQFFVSMENLLESEYCKNIPYKEYHLQFYENWINTCDTLKGIAEAELAGQELTSKQISFIRTTIGTEYMGCFEGISGWYPQLYYMFGETSSYMKDMDQRGNKADDFVVADVHTIPTDENGGMVGWVLHAGTGRINMAVITAPVPGGGTRAYIGPVSSYYEFLSENFKRLTDEEWREMDGAPAYRPEFTNLYLAKDDGKEPVGDKSSLFVIASSTEEPVKVSKTLNLKNFPNPFKTSTIISFTIPKSLSDKKTEAAIYDMNGTLVNTLTTENLPANNYSIVWDGTDNTGRKMPAGTYIYTVKTGSFSESGKMTLVR